MLVWTIGAGGLLGSALGRVIAASADASAFRGEAIPWDRADAAEQILGIDAQRFAEQAGNSPWAVIWAAGRATVSSTREETQPELAALQSVVDAIRLHRPAGRGAFFLTSSAGGVYAGSAEPPFSVGSIPVPLSPYGELKLAQEQLVTEALGGTVPTVIGRVSNLYGTGQDLTKLQGLVSRLVLAAVRREQVNMFVPLDTIRDYVYADDAATMILELVRDAQGDSGAGTKKAIVASGEATSLGHLINIVKDVTRTRIPIAMGVHASASAQSPDLRFVPSPRSALCTPLPVGVKKVYLDVLARVQHASI